MRISDWSSDVCSSDLVDLAAAGAGGDMLAQDRLQGAQFVGQADSDFKETVVHRPQLAAQGAVRADALGRCVGGHAADWHRGSMWDGWSQTRRSSVAQPAHTGRHDRKGVGWGKRVYVD